MEKNYCLNYPIIKNDKRNYIVLAYNKDEYLKAKKFIGICNLSHQEKIIVSGESSLDLINSLSLCNLKTFQNDTIMTVFFKKRKFLGEAQVIKISNHRFVIVMEKAKNLYKELRKLRKKFLYTVVHKATNDYSFFSFHGDMANHFFEKISDKHLHLISRQGYKYYSMLCYKKDEKNILAHFTSQNFILLGLYAHQTFLYDNNVIDDFTKIKKKHLFPLLATIYKDKSKLNIKSKKNLAVEKYEVQGNFLLDKKHKIYNNKRRPIGFVYSSYYLPFKNIPYILTILNPEKASKIAILKHNKKEILIKKAFVD